MLGGFVEVNSTLHISKRRICNLYLLILIFRNTAAQDGEIKKIREGAKAKKVCKRE